MFAMAVPAHYTHQHLMLLSELAELFSVPDIRQALREAAMPARCARRWTCPSCECRMNTSITARELFEQQRERLGLRWAAGKSGEKRELEAGNTVSRRPSLAGYLNAIYPNKVQILGTEELSWLDALEPRQRWETIEKIMQSHPLALVLTRNQACPEDLRAAADESGTPLAVAQARPRTAQPPVLPPGAHAGTPRDPAWRVHGDLLDRRADHRRGRLGQERAGAGTAQPRAPPGRRRCPEFTQIAPDVLDGTCPELLQDLLEVRGLGVLNVREMFGDTAVKKNKYLRLIVHLTKPMTEPTRMATSA